MARNLVTFKIEDWVVLGRLKFSPPYKASDQLINEARIVYVLNGSSKLHSANQSFSLKSGDIFIMKTDNFINDWVGETSEEFEIIVFQLQAELIRTLYKNDVPNWLQPSNSSSDSMILLEDAKSSQLYFQLLRHYIEQPDLLQEELIKDKYRELLRILISDDNSGKVAAIFSNLFKSTNYEFQDTIAKHLFENLTIEDLAFLCNMSLSSFKRKFNQVFGTSPNKYIISKRLDKAQTMLKSSDLSISEIAYECGFSDVSYFSKSFKKYYHYSPSEIKK